MKLLAAFFCLLMEFCSRMRVCVSTGLIPQMTSVLCSVLLFALAVTSPLGLDDVFFSPHNQTIREGQAVFFQCVSGESSPPANITWIKDGQLVTRGRQFQGEYGGGQQQKTSGTLHLLNVTLEDDGTYICVTHNSLLNISKESRPAKLTVQGALRRLQITQGPDNITVAMGAEVYMQCTVRGFPVPMVHWFKDDCLLSNCSASFSLQNNGQLLTFRNVTKEDEGSYQCEASNQKETIRSQPAFLLLAEMHWSFVQQPTSLKVKRGDNVTMTCRPPFSRPEAQVSWFKNNQLLSPSENTSVLPSGDLFFQSIQVKDRGSYFCRASNTHLQRFLTSRKATLTVLAPPSVRLWPTVLTVPAGARAALECEVSGHPQPSISWIKRGHSKQTGGKIALGQRNATLYIQSARSYDEAIYVCEASNILGKSQSTALLRVAVSPIIVTYVSQVSCRTGASVVLPCGAVGILPITYSWTRGRGETKSPVGHSGDKHADEDGALHMSGVQSSDAGEYFCTARNRAGRHQKRTVLTVTDEDHQADATKQALSASSNTSEEQVFQLRTSRSELNLNTAHRAPVLAQQRMKICSSCTDTTTSLPREVGTEFETPTRSRVSQQTTTPAQPFITQVQPPILPPPPHPHFQSAGLHYQQPPKNKTPPMSNNHPVAHSPTSLGTSELLGANPDYLQTSSQALTSSDAQLHLQNGKELVLAFDSQQLDVHDGSPEDQITEMSHLQLDSYTPPPTLRPVTQIKAAHSVTVRTTFGSESYQSETPAHRLRLNSNPNASSQTPQPQPSSFLSQTSQTLPHQSPTASFPPNLEISAPPSASVPETQPSQVHGPISTPSQQHPSLSSPHDPSSPKLDHGVNWTNQQNSTKLPSNTHWLKNTSQSPMTSNNPKATQVSPSWLPMLEKHDIPIVVGVGVSLAFIFITVTFYSVVQKNEPVPAGRVAQRSVGVPVRHADGRVAERTYENRAFEDDDCVTVIEQTPNTSDTRARPPGAAGLSLQVQVEPGFEEVQEVTQPAADHHAITIETYPEPIVDTKMLLLQSEDSLEDDKRCSSSQPSIQLQCTEDWTSSKGDNHSPCQDALPPPSSLPSPSPSPPSRLEDTLRSSLTFRSSELSATPVRHSLSISRGNPPLLLSHHVSLGSTTVAVDVQFYPSATASMAVSTSTQIGSTSNPTSVTAPLFSPYINGQEDDDRSTARFHQ
nr:mucin-2 [Nothobranchius furzeri]